MTDRTSTHFRGRHYAAEHITGPVPFLNPTTRLFPLHKPQPPSSKDKQAAASQPPEAGDHEDEEKAKPQEQPSSSSSSSPGSGIYHVWRSRDNRKGRHALVLSPSKSPTKAALGGPDHPITTNTARATLGGISRMALRYPVWDVSYDVAAIFTLGSAVWVLNGFLVLLPTTNPASSWAGESTWGGGVSAAVGASIFEFGSVLLMLEAVNENRSDCFGWALQEALEEGGESYQEAWHVLLRKERDQCRHHHRNRRRFLATRKGVEGGTDVGLEDNDNTRTARRWTWWPSWYELRTHYLREIGFLACLSQMIGATVFWISGFTGLPQVLGTLSVPAENGIYWLPQVSNNDHCLMRKQHLHVAGIVEDGIGIHLPVQPCHHLLLQYTSMPRHLQTN